MATTYTVKKGDTLNGIAQNNLSTIRNAVGDQSLTVDQATQKLAEWNNIKNANLIYVGQVITISGSSGSGTVSSTSSSVIINQFGLQSNSDGVIFVTWDWTKEHTESYQVKWQYYTGDNVYFMGSDSTVYQQQSTYTMPKNAIQVRVSIMPISQKYTVNNKDVSYWTGTWTDWKYYDTKNTPPKVPSTPSISITNYNLTITVNNIDDDAEKIIFEIVGDAAADLKLVKLTVPIGREVIYTMPVSAGKSYKARCRTARGDYLSGWSDFTNSVGTGPAATSGITVCKAKTKTSAYLEWAAVSNATSYDMEYATKKEYFDGSDQTITVTGIEFTHYEKNGLETGHEYFFRVRAVNKDGKSPWSDIKSVIIAKKPSAPTTWSSTTTGIIGELLTLYWVHNSEDASTQQYAQIELTINGQTTTETIDSTTEEDDQKTSHYSVDTSGYSEGAKILWRVKTKGIADDYSDWSIQRTIDIYSPPTLSLSLTGNGNGESIGGSNKLKAFDLFVSMAAYPTTQTPVSYHLSITADDDYEAYDDIGNSKVVSAGEEIYSKNFDTSSKKTVIQITPGDINLKTDESYTVTGTVSMNSGLIAEDTANFEVSWSDYRVEPNLEIAYDKELYLTWLSPYCEGSNGQLLKDVTLSVYRREFDGGFTKIATDLSNERVFVIDQHPALDFARYRVVSRNQKTGTVSYYDAPGYPIQEKAIIIQWDETWSNYNSLNGESFFSLNEPVWAGSLIRLPYNVDVSESYSTDYSLVEYIGRKHPVSYYGTQLGEAGSWNVEIDKNDTDTIYALRRLAIWMGDVYVREPSGMGYWAKVEVTFSQKHCELTIPVSLTITRVEGGA